MTTARLSIQRVTGAALAASALLAVRATRRLEEARRDAREARRVADDRRSMLVLAGEIGRYGGWTADLASNRVVWTDEVARIHGMPPGFSPDVEQGISFYVPEHRDRIRAAFERCAVDGESFEEELQIIRSDGERVWVDARGRAERGPDGRVVRVHGAFQDISDRKRAELAAEESRRRLGTMADALPLMVWAAGPDGNIDFFSRGLVDYAGIGADDVLDDAWIGLVHPDDRARAVEHWSRSVSEGVPYTVEFRIRRRDGAYRWHLTRATEERDEHGTIVRWWGSSTDIEDLRALEEQTRELNERLSDTLESIGDAVLGLDTDWTITLVNKHAEQLLQHRRDELVGRNVWEIFPDAVGSEFQEQYERAVAERRPVRFDEPFPPLGIHAEVSAYPHAQGLTVYFRDITEQRQVAEQLAHAQRLDSLGRLTGGVAHDFNNLLMVVQGCAELLADQLEGDERLLPLVDTIATTVRRGSDLTRSLLAFARRAPLHPAPVDLNELVAETEPMLAHPLGEGITLVSRLDPALPLCRADRSQVQNALLNLCLNARDAMPSGGRLTITTRRAVLDEAYAAQHPEVEPGDYVLLAVADDGEGIAAEDRDRIFEPFFTTKPPGKGSGLGLAMVYGLLKQSRGHVSVESEPGVGTTFELYLPVHGVPGDRSTPPSYAEAGVLATGRGRG